MIDIRKLKELVRLMVAHDLTEVDLRDAEEQVTLRRQSVYAPPQVVAAPPVMHAAPMMASAAPAAASGNSAAAITSPPIDEEAGLIRIVSPMVGTFYSRPNPDAPSFVSVGAPIGAETVVCLIEAMKIFNEIKAECSGTIHKVLANNGQAVEFGQPLFLVKP